MTTPPISGLSGAVQLSLPGVSSGGGTGSATGVPPGILALPNGTLLKGQIVQVETSGFAVLRTPKGDLTLKSDLPLKRGNEVILRLETLHGDLRARIISVDGLTPRELGRLEPPLPPAASSSSRTVEDVVDLPDQSLLNRTAGTSAPPPAIEDSVEIAPQTPTAIRAVLLSRAPELPTLLKQLPASVFVSPQRLDSGAVISLSLLPQSIALPGQMPQPMPPVLPLQTSLPAPSSPVTSAPSISQATPATHPPVPVLTAAAPPLSAPPPMTMTPPLPAPMLPAPPVATPTMPPALPPATPGVIPPAIVATPATAPTLPATPAIVTPVAVTSPAPAATPPVIATANLAQTPTITITSSVSPLIAATPVAPAAEAPTRAAPGTTATTTTPATPSAPLPPTATVATPLPQEPDSPAALLTRGIVTAQVIGTEQSGETVLKTPLGMVKLDLIAPNGQRLTLPHDTTLKLQLHALEPAETLLPNLPSASPSAPATVPELARHWHSLPEMLGVLQQSHPQIAQELVQAILPRPGPGFARDVFLFLIGLRSETPEEWLGKKTLESLEQSLRGDLARRFSAEMGTLRQLYADTPPPTPGLHWQTAFIPVYYEGEWHQNRFFIKRDKPKTAQEAGEATGTRFIMEVDFSRLGPMQFDGFVKKLGASTQFDLIIRSAAALATDHQNAIRAIFAEASELTGFKGGLIFQVGQPFPLLPLEEVLRSDRNVIA